MRKTSITLFLGLSLIALLSAMMWPADFLDKVKERIASFQEILPLEKVYVQADKMHYRAGETVWLAGYVRDLQDFAKAGQSEILHIELLNSKGKRVESRGLQLTAGKAEGSLELPADLATGNYQLRAYTIWQLNEKHPAIFHKQIFVKGKEAGEEGKMRDTAKSPKLDLLPEGGYMVQGLKSRVAFKVTDQQGHPLDVEGVVKDSRGQQVATFSSAIDGMGAFELTPDAGAYQVEIIHPTQGTISQRLPAALPQGVVLRLEETGDEIARVSIQSSRPRRLGLVLRQGESVTYSAMADVQAGDNSWRIPLRDMQMGIAQLTVFDEAERPLAERLLYVQSGKQLKIDVQTDKESYGPREEVKLSLTVNDEAGRPCAADLSLSAIEAELADAAEGLGSDILSWMTLESELKGSIHQPQKYLFSHNNSKLDYLLMTHGWRRYDWQQLLREEPVAPALQAEQLALRGVVLNAYNQQPIIGAQVMLSDKDQVVRTDEAGRFWLPRTQPERAVTLYVSAAGFGTQQQRIIGMPGELRYELQVQPVVTPRTAARLAAKPSAQTFSLEKTAPDFAKILQKQDPRPFMALFWPGSGQKTVPQADLFLEEVEPSPETNTFQMDNVDIVRYGRIDVFPRDPNLQSVTQFEGKDIQNLPGRSVNDLAALSSGVYQSDTENAAISIRGALPSSTQYIVDGVKVRGGAELPKVAMDKVQIFLSGSPAEYGDFTGGVVVMESKSPRMMWLMDTVAVIEILPQATNLEEVLSKLQPLPGELQGNCEVMVFVDKNGLYKRHKVVSYSDRAWAKRLKPHLSHLQFEPAMTTAGAPYPYHVNMPFYFYADEELAIDHPTDTFNLPELRSSSDFYAARSFYQPSAAELQGKTDERTTLYWNGRLSVPASGKLTVRFRTSDVATRFRVRVEGIGANGLLGRREAGSERRD